MKIFKVIIILMMLIVSGCQINEFLDFKSQYINADGRSILTRINVPEGYHRIDDDDFSNYIRNYALKKDGSKIHLYDGSLRFSQRNHVAIFDLPLDNKNLQQCADSIMAMYARYYYDNKEYDKIQFHFVNGFLFKYKDYMNGYRITIQDNKVSKHKTKDYDNSLETFEEYLDLVFSYASTLSMEEESYEIDVKDIKIGDIFIEGGSPGHVIMVVDVCENEQGKKAFLLAQGSMPAQEFHIIKNQRHKSNPWYYEDEVVFPFKSIEYTFNEGSLRRLNY